MATKNPREPFTRIDVNEAKEMIEKGGVAGALAMNQAFENQFGIADGFARSNTAGRTDLGILADALASHGIGGGHETHLGEFLRRYYALLPQTLREKDGYLMPGFPQLL